MSLILFIVTLAVLVLIHEFGHFIAAKRNGVRVEEFGFGFPPRLFGKKIGETLYSINLIPVGGFVRLFGEEQQELQNVPVTADTKQRSFVHKRPWQKALIIVAGVCMNLVLGVGIYYGLLATHHFTSEPIPLYQTFHFRFGQQKQQILIVDTQPNSPAQHAGITSEDLIIAFNGNAVVSKDTLISEMNAADNHPVLLTLENVKNGNRRTVQVIPQYNAQIKRAIIGIGLADVATVSYTAPLERVFSGFLHAYNIISYTFHTFGYFIHAAVATKSIAPVSASVSGPIGIYRVVNDIVVSSGKKFVTNLLNLIALLSVSLAVMNILPFPALDGGRLVLIMYEWIWKKQVNPRIEQTVNYLGFVFLLCMILLVTYNDISKLFMK